MVHLTDKDIIQEPENSVPIGTEFWESYEGLTMGGFGKVSKCWQVDEYLMSGYFSCRLISSNTVATVNPNYKKPFHINTINALL